MGIQLNFGDHVAPYKELTAIPGPYRADARWARAQAKAIANTNRGANAHFRSLGAGRTLSSLLDDGRIWVNYVTLVVDGIRSKNEIGIGYLPFNRGRIHVLAVLIHELAHVAGAKEDTTKAEEALVHCGLGSQRELDTGIDDPNTPYIPGFKG
ncbi:MAG TPA: hypothetical protein VJV79_12745 [Polyangiaceae bacterium]|nr:hypothetical protein [Polyangiaceae bacterium]